MTDINIVKPEQEIEILCFNKLRDDTLVVDVRPELEFKMCCLPKTLNYSYTKIMDNIGDFIKFLDVNTTQLSKNGKIFST